MILLYFSGYPVIGNHSRMQSSGSCLRGSEDGLPAACVWDSRIDGLFFHQTTIIIALSNAMSFLGDVKNLRDMNPDALCGTELYSGFLMRPRLKEDVLEEIEQMALFKYQGLPQWGKNRNLAFLGVSQKYGSMVGKFVEVMKRFDPEGLFSSEWSDAMLGLDTRSLVIQRKGCALEGLCICSSDQGYYCKHGMVYTEARVCRKANDS